MSKDFKMSDLDEPVRYAPRSFGNPPRKQQIIFVEVNDKLQVQDIDGKIYNHNNLIEISGKYGIPLPVCHSLSKGLTTRCTDPRFKIFRPQFKYKYRLKDDPNDKVYESNKLEDIAIHSGYCPQSVSQFVKEYQNSKNEFHNDSCHRGGFTLEGNDFN